jgi:hypothetical protein
MDCMGQVGTSVADRHLMSGYFVERSLVDWLLQLRGLAIRFRPLQQGLRVASLSSFSSPWGLRLINEISMGFFILTVAELRGFSSLAISRHILIEPIGISGGASAEPPIA